MTETKIYSEMSFNIAEVVNVYVGKPKTCRCGCAGTYSYSKAHQAWSSKNRGYKVEDNNALNDADDEINDVEIQRVIKKMNKHHMIGIDVIDDYIYDMQIGQKVYTVYLKE